jgi:hypothetical protein
MVFPIVAPPDSPEDDDLNKLKHFVRELSCKYELFWLNGSRGKNFSITSSNFCIFVIISLLKRTWPFICTIQHSLDLMMICSKFDWNWPVGSGEEFFFNINTWIWFSLLLPLPTPGDHDLDKLESTLYKKAFM